MSESRKGGRPNKTPASATKKPAKKTRARAAGTVFEKLSAICLALPDTVLTMTWGSPHFRVANKIFCGFGEEDGKPVLSCKLKMAHAQQVVKEPRFRPAKYVGKHGWVSMDLSARESWGEVATLIRESYELIAPPASRAKLR